MPRIPASIRDLGFWHYQIGGWLSMALLQTVITTLSAGHWEWQLLSIVLLQVALGFILTSLLRYVYRRVRYQTLSLFSMISLIVVCSAGVAAAAAACILFVENMTGRGTLSGPNAGIIKAILVVAYTFPDKLAWSALYFGVKFWRDWQDECEQTARATEEAVRAQLQMLRYRLNPRFLFDVLESVRALVDEDPSAARKIVTELSEFLRYALMSRKRPDVPLTEELEAVRLYLSIEQQRRQGKLEVVCEIPDAAKAVLVPSFLVCSLVENVLERGVQTGAHALSLKLRAGITNGTLRLSIACPGGESRLDIGSHRWLQTMLQETEPGLRDRFAQRCQLTSRQEGGESLIDLEVPLTSGASYDGKGAGDHR